MSSPVATSQNLPPPALPLSFSSEMFSLKCPAQVVYWRWKSVQFPSMPRNVIVCATKGPRPRFPRVWKSKPRIGTISKAKKLVDCDGVHPNALIPPYSMSPFHLGFEIELGFSTEIKGLSNVKEEVYGALDAFVAWDLEFPLITVKKALKTLEDEKEWKRIIQVTKWMLSKGQGKTMGSYFTLLNALAEDGRIDEAEELWTRLFNEHLESMPRMFFDKIINIYYRQGMQDKMFELNAEKKEALKHVSKIEKERFDHTFADMEELGIRPTSSIIQKLGNVFMKLGMLDKYEKLNRKYPPPKWEYRYIKGKRIRVRSKQNDESNVVDEPTDEVYEENVESDDDMSRSDEDSSKQLMEFLEFSRPGSIEVNQTGE